MLVQQVGALKLCTMAEGQDTLSISQAKDEKTKAWTSAGSQSATSKGARFEDDEDSRG